jgi:hypothetical protein
MKASRKREEEGEKEDTYRGGERKKTLRSKFQHE